MQGICSDSTTMGMILFGSTTFGFCDFCSDISLRCELAIWIYPRIRLTLNPYRNVVVGTVSEIHTDQAKCETLTTITTSSAIDESDMQASGALDDTVVPNRPVVCCLRSPWPFSSFRQL